MTWVTSAMILVVNPMANVSLKPINALARPFTLSSRLIRFRARSLFLPTKDLPSIVGLKASDSSQLLNLLYHHINQPEHQVRFQWSQGAIAMWDNRCTWHCNRRLSPE